MTIDANIKARQAAETIFQLAVEESQQLDESAVLTFWAKLLLLVEGVLPEGVREPVKTDKPSKMTDEECQIFERYSLDFGKYAGAMIKDTPLDYLLWLDNNELSSFKKDLHRYLASDRVQREQEDD